MKNQIVRFLKDEEGATAIEYGLIAGLIAIAIIAGTTDIGEALGTIFNDIATSLQSAISTPAE